MIMKKYAILACLVIAVTVITIALPVVASESRYFNGAQDYFDRHCNRTRVQGSNVLDCFLFEQVQSILIRFSNVEHQIQILNQQIANIQTISGPKGDKGDQGISGVNGLAGYEIISKVSDPISPQQDYRVDLPCPANKKVISSGYSILDINTAWQNSEFRLYGNDAFTDGTGWAYGILNVSEKSIKFESRIICGNIN